MEKIVVGKILKSQGIKGEVKVLPITDDVTRFKKLKTVFIDENEYKVESVRIDSSFAYVKFCEVTDRNTADTLKDKEILIDRKDAVKLPEGSYFVVDLIGCKVFVEEKEIGTLTYVLDYTGSANVYEVTLPSGKTMMFPALKKVLKNIDVQNKIIVLDKESLSEVVVYED